MHDDHSVCFAFFYCVSCLIFSAAYLLQVGAQVVLLKRISHQRQLVNGLRGRVLGFTNGMQMPIVKFSNGE
jgi:hypothetical protein